MADYPEQRNLDGCFFRVQREGRWVNVCFTDLSKEEMEQVMANRSREWTLGLFELLLGTINDIASKAMNNTELKAATIALGCYVYRVAKICGISGRDEE